MKSHREISINSSCVCWFSCNDFSLTQRNECFLELIVVFPFPSFDSIQCRVAKWCGRVLQSSVRNKTRHDFISSNTGGTSFVTIFQWIRVKLCWRPNSSLSIRSIESSEMYVCVCDDLRQTNVALAEQYVGCCCFAITLTTTTRSGTLKLNWQLFAVLSRSHTKGTNLILEKVWTR